MRAGALAALIALAPAAAGAAPSGRAKPDFQAAARSRLMHADADRDGKVSAAEWAAAASARATARDPARAFGLLDGNHDGYLDAAEIDAFAARRFARLDADGNGMVTAEERQAARKGRAD